MSRKRFFLCLTAHLREHAGGIVLKQSRIFREHIAAELQVFFRSVHIIVSKKYGQIGDGVFRRASRLFRLGKRLYGKQVPEVMQALPPCVGLGFLVDPRCFQDRHEALRYGAMCQMLTWKPAWKKESIAVLR